MVWLPPRSVWAHDDHIKVWLLGRTDQVKYPPDPFHCHRPTKPSSSPFSLKLIDIRKRIFSFHFREGIPVIIIVNIILTVNFSRAVSQVSSIASSSRDPQLCDQMKGSLIKKQVTTYSCLYGVAMIIDG